MWFMNANGQTFRAPQNHLRVLVLSGLFMASIRHSVLDLYVEYARLLSFNGIDRFVGASKNATLLYIPPLIFACMLPFNNGHTKINYAK